MTELIGTIVSSLVALLGAITAVFYSRRAKRAAVMAAEVNVADAMVDLVKKANAEALELQKKENDKLKKSISRLEQAIRSVNNCPHRSECPVVDQLQDSTDAQ